MKSLIAFAFLIAFASTACAADKTPTVPELQKQVRDLQAQVEFFKVAVGTLKSQRDSCNDQVAQLATQFQLAQQGKK